MQQLKFAILFWAFWLAAGASTLMAGRALAQNGSPISDFAIEYPVSGNPRNIAIEEPGHIWFTAPNAESIAELVTSPSQNGQAMTYTVTVEYFALASGSEPYDIVYNDGVVWFTECAANKIGRLDVDTEIIEEYPVPTAQSCPTGIGVAPNGKVWFTERDGNTLGSLDPDTEMFTEFAFPNGLFNVPNPQVEDLAVSGNSIWFTAPNADAVGYFNVGTSGFFNVRTGAGKRPVGIAVDSTGNPWITAAQSNLIGRYAPGTLSLWAWFSIPTADSGPAGIAFRDNGSTWDLWIANNKSGQATRLNIRPNGSSVNVHQHRLPPTTSQPWGVAVDENGHVWVAERSGNALVEWRPPYLHFLFLPTIRRS